MLEHVACRSRRSSESGTGACQQRRPLLQRRTCRSAETKRYQVQTNTTTRKSTPPSQRASESDDTRRLHQCKPQLSPSSICPGRSSVVGHAICGTLGHMTTNEKLEQLYTKNKTKKTNFAFLLPARLLIHLFIDLKPQSHTK